MQLSEKTQGASREFILRAVADCWTDMFLCQKVKSKAGELLCFLVILVKMKEQLKASL